MELTESQQEAEELEPILQLLERFKVHPGFAAFTKAPGTDMGMVNFPEKYIKCDPKSFDDHYYECQNYPGFAELVKDLEERLWWFVYRGNKHLDQPNAGRICALENAGYPVVRHQLQMGAFSGAQEMGIRISDVVYFFAY